MDELLQEMIAPAPSSSDLARRRRLVSTFAIIALAAIGVTSLTTSALFTDNESVTSGNITTGTVDLSTTAPVSFTVPAGGLAPGDAAFATVTVTNSGSLEYRYAVTYKATDTDTSPGVGTVLPTGVTVTTALLSSQLQLRAYLLAAPASCDLPGTASATPLASAGPALSTDPAMTPFIGAVATGQQTDDRTLSATTKETLCLRVDLRKETTNDYQDTATNITLRFDAEQTVNNP